MKILITGGAGFIGFHLTRLLVKEKNEIVIVDNINNYYSKKLKLDRLKTLGFDYKFKKYTNKVYKSSIYKNLNFYYFDISKENQINRVFKNNKFDTVCHLAAQAGVRYSLEKPKKYIKSNIIGFYNILELIKEYRINHFIYASSSSIYGESQKIPFSINDKVDRPVSLYAATKKSNELFAYSYSHLYNIKTTGLRFFTVYGPWGRPDMAYFLFTDSIINSNPINVFNNGKMKRDFTYVDDITDCIKKIIYKPSNQINKYSIYNIGNNKPVELNQFIKEIELILDKKSIKKILPMQPGDVSKTYADINETIRDFNYKPQTSLNFGLKRFIDWYLKYYNK